MAIKDSRGLWNALSALELASTPEIAKMLNTFSLPVTDCYECGVEVPTLSCKHENTKGMRVAGLFLKRLLNDLRAVWNLLLLGYTSQAGSVAAAAFENALIISCIVGNIRRAEKFMNFKSGGSPWSVAELCKIYTRQLREKSEKSGRTSAHLEDETYCQELYPLYMWLCKLKHPTIPSALHDAFSVSLTGADYIIMAAPDTRIEDLPSKAFILSVTILRVNDAIESLALARELDFNKPNVVSWQKRFDSIVTSLDKAVHPIIKKTTLPFDYKGHILRKMTR